MSSEHSVLNNPTLLIIVIAILLDRLGGNVTIVQKDIDDIAFHKFDEIHDEIGLHLVLTKRKPAQ